MSREDFSLNLCNLMVSLMIYGILEYFFPREDFVPEEDFVLSIFSPLLLTFTCGNDCIWKDFVLGGFCPVPMQLNGQLDDLWFFRVFFFPREDFVPGGFYPRENFVPYPCTPLLCHNCISEDYETRKILSRDDFVLSLCPLLWSTFRLS